jgi:septum formation inhibitor-activating ATPase MinD
MGKVISFINYKGGVGKTTTTYHIGCALADKIFKLGFANRRGYDLLGGKDENQI